MLRITSGERHQISLERLHEVDSSAGRITLLPQFYVGWTCLETKPTVDALRYQSDGTRISRTGLAINRQHISFVDKLNSRLRTFPD
jgi:hypothetical protein